MKFERTVRSAGSKGKPRYAKYAPVWVASGSGHPENQSLRIAVEVNAASDAHVLLKTSNSRAQYEIVLGGWKNSRSEIRKGQQGRPLGSLLHKEKPLAGDKGSFVSVLIDVDRDEDGGQIYLFYPGIHEAVKVRDNKMPKITEVRVATGFGFPGEWRVATEDEDEISDTLEENSPPLQIPAKETAGRISDTPSLAMPKKDTEIPNDADREATPFSAVLRRPALRTPASENTRSPFPFLQHSQATTSALASVRTVLGQFD